MKVAQSCPSLCDPMDHKVHGILQAKILEWLAFPFSIGSSRTRTRTGVSCIAGGFFTNWAMRGKWKSLGRVWLFTTPWTIQSMNSWSTEILEWVARPFSRGFSPLRNQTRVSCIAGGFFTVWVTRDSNTLKTLTSSAKICVTYCVESGNDLQL